MGIKAKRWLLLLLAVPFLLSGQQPQTQTAPPFAVNAKYLDGTGAGYAPTAGSGLTLNLAAGRARCGNPMVNYAGGTLTMANNTTNYVYLDPASSCAPASNTSGYTSALINIATVVTSGGAITSITDDRTLGMENKTGGAPGTGTVTSVATGTGLTGGPITSTGTVSMTTAQTRRTCAIIVGANNASAVIVNADLGPQGRLCFVPAAATIVEIEVAADGGTPNVIPGKNHAGSISNLVSSALATAGSGGIACSNTGGTTGLDGATTCSSTLQNTSLAAGDYIELVSGTAGGTANRMSIFVTYTVN